MGRRKGFRTEEERENQNVQLLPEDKETIINFNQGEKKANIFTYERDWQKFFERELKIKPISVDGWGGREYFIDKNKVKIIGMTKKEKLKDVKINPLKRKAVKKKTNTTNKKKKVASRKKKKGGKYGTVVRQRKKV
jgi:hypothetical protein